MALTAYTSYDNVRAALGIPAKELADATLALSLYVNSLELALVAVDTDMITDFTTASGQSTVASLAFVKSLNNFAAYYVAQMCSSLLLTKSVTDGKAGFIRQSDRGYLDAMARLDRESSRASADLRTKYDAYAGTSTAVVVPPTFLGVSTPSTDPVTGA